MAQQGMETDGLVIQASTSSESAASQTSSLSDGDFVHSETAARDRAADLMSRTAQPSSGTITMVNPPSHHIFNNVQETLKTNLGDSGVVVPRLPPMRMTLTPYKPATSSEESSADDMDDIDDNGKIGTADTSVASAKGVDVVDGVRVSGIDWAVPEGMYTTKAVQKAGTNSVWAINNAKGTVSACEPEAESVCKSSEPPLLMSSPRKKMRRPTLAEQLVAKSVSYHCVLSQNDVSFHCSYR